MRLARSGARVVVLEQASLPRPKACGGLVPEAALHRVSRDWSELVGNRVERRKYLKNHGCPHVTHTPDSVLALVDRARFDSGIVELALELGRGNLDLLERFRVTAVEECADRVLIRSSDGQLVEARYLIAADGAASRTARCLELNSSKMNAVGVDTEVVVSDEVYQTFSDHVLFDYFCLPVGYGWVFPKGNSTLSVGVASWDRRVACKAAMADYLDYTLSRGDIITTTSRAHPIPVYQGRARIASARACLVGDAASLVDPVTGEGIRFALRSGLIAAQSILELLNDEVASETDYDDCRLYQDRLYASMGPHLDALNAFAVLPFRQAPGLYYRRFVTGGQAKAYK